MQNAKLKPLTHLKFISTWVCARRLNKKVMMTCLHHMKSSYEIIIIIVMLISVIVIVTLISVIVIVILISVIIRNL